MTEYNSLEPIELTHAELAVVSGGTSTHAHHRHPGVEAAIALARQSNTATVNETVSLASGTNSKIIVAGHSTLTISESSTVTQSNTNTATT
jgi:hypothetical protein